MIIKKYLPIILFLSIVLLFALLFAAYVYKDNSRLYGELVGIKMKTQELLAKESAQKSDRELKHLLSEFKSLFLSKEEALEFVAKLERDLQSVADRAELVSISSVSGKDGENYFAFSISATGNLSDLENLLRLLENIRYPSYVDSLSLDAHGEGSLWNLNVRLLVLSDK